MNIQIREINEESLQGAKKCDATIMVDSKLVLRAEDGVISYSVLNIEPYQKPYIFEEKEYPTCISNPDKTVYFAYVDGHLAGEIDISKHWNAYAWINDFAVDIEFRKHGVGHALMQKAVEWTKSKGLPGIMLEAQNNNVTACRFYEKFGFKLRGFDTHLYKGLHPATDEIALYWYLVF